MAFSPGPEVAFLVICLPFFSAALIPALYRPLGERTGYVGVGVALVCFGLLSTLVGTEATVSIPWIPALGVAFELHVDGWALLFALLASGIGALVFTYSVGYMHGESGLVRYYGALLAFMGSILGVALAGDLIALFLFWELTSVCSFLLIGHHSEEASSQYAARMAMVVTVGGGLFVLVGFLALFVVSGSALGTETLSLTAMLEEPEAMRAALREAGLFVPVLALIAVGAASKSAQVPLHFWLPNAMEAPTPVSAFLHSATMVKVGVYLVGRLRPLLESSEWMLLFATLGLATMAITAMLAVAATDIKELLAYSTASHLGLMIAGFGFTVPYGGEAGVFHLLNHALFKAPLFLVAGIVSHEVGTRRIDELGGLRHDLPFTALITVIAALGMAGFPPFNGFYSKELLFEAAYEVGHAAGGLAWLYPLVAVFASVFTVLYSLRFLALFFGARPEGLGTVHRPSQTLLVPPAVLAAVAALVGIAPQFAVDNFVGWAVEPTALEAHEMHAGLPTSLSPPVVMSIAAIGLGAVTYPFYTRVHDAVRSLASIRALRPNWWYDTVFAGLDSGSARVIPTIQNGLLRTYVTWFLGAACVLTLAGYAVAGVSLPAYDGIGVPLSILLILTVGVAVAVAVTVAPSHIAGVLTVSVLGVMIAVFYVLASAPDLGLTQLVVETLALLVFLLIIEQVPEYYGDLDRRVAIRDVGLSAVVGATVFLTVLLTTRTPPGGGNSIARYFTEQAVPGGGGSNVVNVILVDFRGFDTLGEITVIAIAAIAVLALMTMREGGEAT
ncbi:hydrogen gas-evolving membrane-bound hydrogenase subunit E [Halalkalicoccus jeotgali]|uniref:NADH/Ubiquinone/plastoquinone (Complex I) n=1 Tax=Halalkalicoccus jeotgali (strain DSM 18796 / CECT 7217 / JCM 14584 / KCTC 4019 / B3) TaxID=795797 RepID=D8J8U0_HALJB|nr:hydrogen gas-evolving membrane-bound hydrogenase subunit E [Halalkalicoccus jeotgali]ADJ14275.1 NADH/Ubiquinone/plastoquinone (complex I) [Halalkalicoccus jeotgali B3]ELY40537.1 NADH/Ubiquinone/plastoquinone (complex I) [Halalkalicoccus jeotgali B3]